MLSQIYRFKRLVALFLVTAFCVSNTSMVVIGAEITKYDKLPTNTTINKDAAKAIWNIQTTTTAKGGTVGVNTFSKFNVSKGDVVNLRLINQQNKLVNLVFDSSASQINGIVNSFKGNQIGGNVLFANPHGFVIGKDGVFNVGSLTLMTPKEDVMKKIFDGSNVSDTNIDNLITFKFGKDNYYVGTKDDGSVKLEMVPAEITIEGKINSAGGIDIMNGGRTISIAKDAELNANMQFSGDTTGENITASKGTKPTVTDTFATAMNDGKGITIVSQNCSHTSDYLSSIVNIEGKVHANGGNVIAQTETSTMDKSSYDSAGEGSTSSLINVKTGADIEGYDVTMRALSSAKNGDHDIIGITEGKTEGILSFFNPAEWAEIFVDDFVHLGKMLTKVTVENGAKITADNDIKLYANTDLSAFSASSVFPTFAFGLTNLDITTESRVKSGANLTAKNLTVQSITNMKADLSVKSTSVQEVIAETLIHKSFGHFGAYSLGIALIDTLNRAIIENNATLTVTKDINVLASTLRDIKSQTKNGFLPIVDRNRGEAGIAVEVAVIDSVNEAIMNADANISGQLIVNAEYTGNLVSTVGANSGAIGEDGSLGMGGKITKGIFKLFSGGYFAESWGTKIDNAFNKIDGNSAQRAQATFNKLGISGAVNVGIDTVKNNALIGDSVNNIKPTITAKNVVVGSTLTDHKSHIYASSETDNAITSTSGAVAVNIKNLDANAKAYADMNLDGGDNKNALIINSNTIVERPTALDSLWSVLDALGILKYTRNAQAKIEEVNSNNVAEYLKQYGVTDDMQENIDKTSSITNLMNVFNYLDFNTLGMDGFFNSFATSQANARAKEGKTSAYAGAFNVSINMTGSNAELVGGSVVTLKGADDTKNNILIQANTNSTLWAGASLSSLFNAKDLFAGMSARDGDSAGGSFSIQYGNIDTTAIVGQGAVIKADTNGKVGNVDVKAIEEGQFVNIGVGSASADESGLGGTIIVTALAGGETKAAIESGADIHAKDANVDAQKDDKTYHAVFAYSNSKNSKSFGISTIGFGDTAESYIAGTLNTTGNVLLNATYDKLFLNTALNVGIAKSAQSQAPDMPNVDVGNIMEGDNAPVLLEEFFGEDGAILPELAGNAGEIVQQVQNADIANNANGGYTKTSAYAGNLLLTVANSDVKATIKDGAKVTAGGKVDVKAKSTDKNIEAGAILSANGDNGGGATITFNLNKNNIQATIGSSTNENPNTVAAEVDSGSDITVEAEEDNTLVGVSAGIAQAKDSSGAGAVSLDIQYNNIEAGIKDGAKINTKNDLANQSVKVDAKFTSHLVKAIGAVSVQATGAGGSGAKGASIDTDALSNKINAYIKGAEVNAGKSIDVSATSNTRLIDISASGAVSTTDAAYDGTLGLFVSKNSINSYIENSQINKSTYGETPTARQNKAANINITAENKYNDITVTGTISGGKGTAAGGAIRVDYITDMVKSYITGSDIDTTGDLKFVNNSILDTVAVTAAGTLSTGANAFGGAIMLVVDDVDQDSYIDNSTIISKSLTMDTDAKFDTVGVTGGITASTSGSAIGGALYVAVLENDINTYIQNSDITTTNDLTLTTDNNIDVISVTINGSGGTGLALSGAIGVLVNNSDSNTYIKSESGKKNKIKSTAGTVTAKGTNTFNIKMINASVAVSTDTSIAANGTINTIVDNNDLLSYIEGVNVDSNKGADVEAVQTEEIMSIAVGVAGSGNGVSISGSVNTVIMASDVHAYIKNAIVESVGAESDVTVYSKAQTRFTGGTGGLSISTGSAAIGASIVTGVINNHTASYIENSKIDVKRNVTVSAVANETIGDKNAPFITVAGGFSQYLTLEGAIETLVINSTGTAYITGTKTIGDDKFGVKTNGDVTVSAEGNTTLWTAIGAVSASGVIGIGATVNTVVIDKDILSESENAIITAKNIKSSAKTTDTLDSVTVAAGAAGTVGGAGVVNTNVITSDVKTGFKNSTLTATENIESTSEAKAEMMTITGAVAGGGVAGVGLSAVNDVIRYRLAAYLDNVTATFDELKIDAKTDNTYKFSTVSGAGGGTAGVAGVENVNYINNEVKAYATGNLTGNKATINAKDKVTFKNSYSGVIGGGGVAGVGASVEVNKVTSTVLAYIGGDKVKVKDIDVKAEGEQTYDHIVVAGFAVGGTGAGAGTALANVIETTVKAYVADGAKIYLGDDDAPEYTNSVSLNATNTIDLTEDIGAIAFGLAGGGVGATVAVNKINNTVEAYTGNDVGIKSKDIRIKAESNNNLGNANTGGSLLAVAGAGGLYAGIAGTVMYNSVKDTVNAYVGKNNIVKIADNGELDIQAKDITKIYDGTGAVAGGAGGIGASVDYNVVENTVVAFIGASSDVQGKGSVSVVADSQETVNNAAYVIAGGIGALSGGVLYLSVGKKVGNASYNNFDDEKDKENFKSAENQANNNLNTANEKISGASDAFNKGFNDALDRITQNKNTAGSRVREMSKKSGSDELYKKSSQSGSSIEGTDRNGTTSAFVDTGAKIKTNNLVVNAKNSNNLKLKTLGVAVGAVGIGVAAAVTDDTTTTNAFVQNNADIDVDSFTLKSESTDQQDITTTAAVGGIVGGSGSVAHINSNKTTNTYINNEAKIKTTNDMLITAVSKSSKDTLKTTANAHGYGGVAVGVSTAHTTNEGNTKIDIGDGVSLVSDKGNITIKTDADEGAYSDAWAATGALAGGTGAESFATVGKDTRVTIGKNFSAVVNDGSEDIKDDEGHVIGTKTFKQGKIEITSNTKNNALAESNGRAYGGISAGGTKTRAKINHKSGVKITDADSAKTIRAREINILSLADNKVKATTYAGAGAAVGTSGSGVFSEITSNDDVYVGKNYNIEAGKYSSKSSVKNDYLSYNKSNAFGVICLAIPFIDNTITSTVNNESYANINSDSSIVISAANEVLKKGVDGYDIYGGSGGLAGGAGGHINDKVTMKTQTKLGGDKAYAMGKFGTTTGNGSIDVSAYNIANINEKADLYSHGGIVGADMDSIVKLEADADINVSNKDIRTKDDHISYAARNDVDIYTKSNVESYGGAAGAGGEATAVATKVSATVTFEKDAHSTSGRDTNISAVSNKSLESYMYARTRGLISALNDESNAKSQNSRAYIYINGNGDDNETTGNAVITAFDSINISALNTASKIRADRDSKAYQLWCIPYTGKGNKNTENTRSGQIVLNGILKSGEGFNKSLHLNINGDPVDENGNVVENGKYGIFVNKEQVGTITTADIDVDIAAYEQSKTEATNKYNDFAQQEREEISNCETIITNNTNAKNTLIANNNELNGKINTATTDKENKQTELNTIKGAYDNMGKLDGTDQEFQDFINTYGSIQSMDMTELITACMNYREHPTDESCISAYNTAKATWVISYAETKGSLESDITSLSANINAWGGQIEANNIQIGICENAITTNQAKINNLNANIEAVKAQYEEQIAMIDAEIARLEEMKEQGSEIPVYSMIVDDVIIRSGQITFNGDSVLSIPVTRVSGNGYIHVPGNNASIVIQNDSVSNMVFNKLIINGNLSGGIKYNGTVKDSTVHVVSSNSDKCQIKVLNTVDRNDPTINLDKESNAGDLVFRGNVENPNGAVEITNYTGNVLTEAGITARDLHIRVPNGAYEQKYTNTTQQIGGSSSTGAIVAAGDITIAANTIDINGLIKSGTEIKEATIPDLTVIKRDGKYYQKVGDTETEMTASSTTAGYYYLNLSDDNSDVAVLRQIRAYFKPSDLEQTGNDIEGDIYLFKADTVGGNITLTGNIINTSGTGSGKIELVNGYGHINVTNNSKYTLITSSLNADDDTKGVLTINDFKFASGGDSTFANLTQASLTDDFIKEHAGTYTAKVDDNGNIVTTAINKTTGNGSWGDTSTSTTADGADVYSVNYVPGDDAYYVQQAGETVGYWRYVSRSWWTELWYGKKYVWETYYKEPVYGVAKNPVQVNFVGFKTPEINVTSKGDIVMNNSISSLPGTINIKSDGDITTRSLSYSISGKNINLISGGDGTSGTIGQYDSVFSTVKPLQVIVYDDGKLVARGKEVYLNYPKTGVSNIDIDAYGGSIYLATDSGSIDMAGKTLFGLQANNLELHADSVNLNPADLGQDADYRISIHNWIVRAKDDIYIQNKGSITAKYIVSENNGKIVLRSEKGSIFSGATDAYSDYNIHGGSYNIYAPCGMIGEADKPLTFARAGIYNVIADGDVYMLSNSKMHIDRVTSVQGNVNLKAQFGIIASDITTTKSGKEFTYQYDNTTQSYIPLYTNSGEVVPEDDRRVYHISSGSSTYIDPDTSEQVTKNGNIRLVTNAGNLENLTVDTDGVITAYAGFNVADDDSIDTEHVNDATSDINITLLSKALPQTTPTMTEEEAFAAYDIENRKDMTIKRIFATQNVTLSSERGVSKEVDSDGVIYGSSITINAVGDVGGSEDSTALNFGTFGEVSVYTKADSNVRIFNVGNLKINRIDVTNNIVKQNADETTYGSDSNSIGSIKIYSIGDITNAINDKEVVDTKTTTTISGVDAQTQEPTTQKVEIDTKGLADKKQTVPNIRGKNIEIATVASNIGDYNNELIVETTSSDGGLKYDQMGWLSSSGDVQGAFIRGVGDTLYITEGDSNQNLRVVTDDTNIVITNAEIYGNADIRSNTGNITLNNITADGVLKHEYELNVLTTKDIVLNGAKAHEILLDSKNATVKGNISTDILFAVATDHATLDGATVGYLSENADKDVPLASMASSGDVTLKDSTINGKSVFVASDLNDLSEVPNNIYVDNVTANDNLVITSTGDTVISTLTVDGDFTNESGKVITDTETGTITKFDGNTSVTGKLTVTGESVISSVGAVVIKEIESKEINIESASADITKLTSAADTTITSTNGDTKISNGTVGGKFTNTSDNTTVTGKLAVTGDAKITSVKDVVINEISSDNLNVDSKNADITKLTSVKDTVINTVNDTTIKDGTVGGKFTNKSGKVTVDAESGETNTLIGNTTVTGTLNVVGDAEITSTNNVTINEISSDNLNIDSKNADITKLTSVKDTEINTSADTKIKDGTVGGKFTNTSENITVTGKLAVTGDAKITSVKDVVINEISSDNLNVDSKNADITKLTSVKDTVINTVNDTTIKDGTVGGKFTNTSGKTVVDEVTGETTVVAGDTKVTGTLTVTGDADIDSTNDVTVTGKINVDKDANINAVDDIKIADGHIKQDMNLDAKTVTIDEIQIEGLINADANTADINTSYDINIGTIQGKDKAFTDTLKIKSAENITNGTNGKEPNIYAKKIGLIAGESIGSKDKSLNLHLPKGNSVSIDAGKTANIKTTGAGPNYKKYKADEAIINADGKVKIKGLDVGNIDLKTTSAEVDITGKVKKRGQIRTEDKRISINNVNFEPDHTATTQLHTANNVFNLKTNASNDIQINSKFVVRHNRGIVINGTDFNSSMESEAVKAGETNRKNSDRRKNKLDDADETVYGVQNLSDDILIKTIHGEIITPENVYDVINAGENLSFNNKTKATIYDKISYLK